MVKLNTAFGVSFFLSFFLHIASYCCCPVAQSCLTFATPWTAAHQASLSLNISWSLPKFMFIASVISLAISSSEALFSFCPQFFPASGTFLISYLFASDDQNGSFSISPSSEYSGLISLTLEPLIVWIMTNSGKLLERGEYQTRTSYCYHSPILRRAQNNFQ